ncbi:hypothetical protein AADE18_001158, partial [Salmonella enterica]
VIPQFKDGEAFSSIGTLKAEVTIYAGVIDAAHSEFTVTPSEIKADNMEQSTLTLTLRDVHDNLVSGVSGQQLFFQLKTSANGNPDGSTYTLGAIQEQSFGVYTATLKGILVDTLTVRPKYNSDSIGEGAAELKATVTLKPGAFKDITVNGTQFTVNSGFPSMGFKGANFILNMPAGITASSYTWSSSQPGWVTVDSSGKVTFSNDASPATKTVTITAIPKTGQSGQSLAYTLNLNKWLINSPVQTIPYSVADTYCTSRGMAMPPYAVLYTGNTTRTAGTLWGEWGAMATYGWGAEATPTTTTEPGNPSYVHIVWVNKNPPQEMYYYKYQNGNYVVVCEKTI